jgi:hypothetical protein
MVSTASDYVGTEQKIDLVGRFMAIVETVKRSKNDDSKTENEVICKLTVPTGYHFKEGFMCSFESDEKPDMKIVSISKYTNHCVCECITWK